MEQLVILSWRPVFWAFIFLFSLPSANRLAKSLKEHKHICWPHNLAQNSGKLIANIQISNKTTELPHWTFKLPLLVYTHIPLMTSSCNSVNGSTYQERNVCGILPVFTTFCHFSAFSLSLLHGHKSFGQLYIPFLSLCCTAAKWVATNLVVLTLQPRAKVFNPQTLPAGQRTVQQGGWKGTKLETGKKWSKLTLAKTRKLKKSPFEEKNHSLTV